MSKEGSADEFLQDGDLYLKKNAIVMEKEAVHRFAALRNQETYMFMEKMGDMIRIML